MDHDSNQKNHNWLNSHEDGDKTASFKKTGLLNFLLPYIRPYIHYLIFAFLLSLPLAGLVGLQPWMINMITQMIAEGSDLGEVIIWMAGTLVVVALSGLLTVGTRYHLTMLHVRLANDIRNRLYNQLQDNPLDFHLNNRTGELASLVSQDTQRAAKGAVELYSSIWQNPIIIICLLSVMIYFNPLLSLVTLAAVPVFGLLIAVIGKHAKEAERKYLETIASMLGLMVESLTNVKQVKSFSLEKQQQQKFAEEGEHVIHLRKKALLLKSLAAPSTDLVAGLLLGAMAIISYWQLTQGLSNPGAIVGCLAAAYALRDPAKRLSNSFIELQTSGAAIQRVSWILNRTERPRSTGAKIEVPINKLEFENIAFSYDKRRDVLKEINFVVSRGQRIAIFGASGAGKTTLIDLLIGFYPCTSGKILANSVDISSLDSDFWRKQIGIVSQEPFLFDDSIEENIRYGHPDADIESIMKAANLAGCDEMLSRLHDGIKTRVGERGSRLSGGERKRVALARALVRPISILILDEATSELDFEVEKNVLEKVDRLSPDLITLHVSHRTSVLDHCDRAILLEKGLAREIAPEKLTLYSRNKDFNNSQYQSFTGKGVK